MEMARSGNGGRKVVTFDDAITGRRRNGSLSSYLDMGRDADGGRAAPRPLPLPAHGMGSSSRRRTYADGELDVFAAERYFRGAMDGGDGDRKGGASVGVHVIAPTVPAAASARSAAAEAAVVAKPSPSSTRASTVSFAASSACSANSQTALLPRPRRSSRGEGCCVKVGVLMRTCSGKRSVRVDRRAAKEAPGAAEPAVAGIDWYKELRMHKAGLSGDGGNSHGLVAAAGLPPPSLNIGTAKVAAVGREEKEVTFSSSSMRRISSFTLVAPVRASAPASGEPGGAGSKGGRAGGGAAHHLHLHGEDGDDDDDAGSESSSDLFEIRSLMIGDCCPYEPSEASIQWSVVTAASASERGDRVPARWVGSGGGGGARGPAAVAGRKVGGHRPPGLLAGCASHMAVDVSPAATTKGVPNAVAAMAVQQRRTEGFQKGWSGA